MVFPASWLDALWGKRPTETSQWCMRDVSGILRKQHLSILVSDKVYVAM